MDITLIGRNVQVTDRFRDYATEKAERVEHLADKALALEIRLVRHHETNGNAGDDRVELTLIGPGPTVRAEAGGADKFAAFDTALQKLMEQVRRAKDRRKVHRGHGNRLTSLGRASAADFDGHGVVPADGDLMRWAETGPEQLSVEDDLTNGGPEDRGSDADTGRDTDRDTDGEEPYSPVNIRRKTFAMPPMTVDDALYRMELVGHDFYLFVHEESGRPTVVYRRKGWDYGVIDIETIARESAEESAEESEEESEEALPARL